MLQQRRLILAAHERERVSRAAVAAAKAALAGWRATSLDERAKYVQRLSEGLMAGTVPGPANDMFRAFFTAFIMPSEPMTMISSASASGIVTSPSLPLA